MKKKKKVYKKVHKKIDGQVIHVNKRWSDLKMGQREFIITSFNSLYKNYLIENKRIPKKEEKANMIDEVYALVREKNICIPFYEFKKHCACKAHKLNLKYLPKKEKEEKL